MNNEYMLCIVKFLFLVCHFYEEKRQLRAISEMEKLQDHGCNSNRSFGKLCLMCIAVAFIKFPDFCLL